MEQLKKIELTNFTIKSMIDSQMRNYYLIIDDNTTNGYFCFVGKVKEGWDLLKREPKPNELIIEYDEVDRNDKILRRTVIIREGNDILV